LKKKRLFLSLTIEPWEEPQKVLEACNQRQDYLHRNQFSFALTCKMVQHVECQPPNFAAVTMWLELTRLKHPLFDAAMAAMAATMTC